MNKGLLIIFFVLFAWGLFLSPYSYAKYAEPMVNTFVHHPENDEIDAIIYPNPAEDNIFVRLDLIDQALTLEAEIEIEIRNILGNPMNVDSERISDSKFRVNTADYSAGYYILIVRCKECKSSTRPSKQAFKFMKK